jgi:hypothetical protein
MRERRYSELLPVFELIYLRLGMKEIVNFRSWITTCEQKLHASLALDGSTLTWRDWLLMSQFGAKIHVGYFCSEQRTLCKISYILTSQST